MKKAFMIFGFVTALAVFATAQTPGHVVNVKLNQKTSSATLKGSVKGHGYVDYVVRAMAGQTLSVGLSGGKGMAAFNVTAPEAKSALFIGSISGDKFSRRLPCDGSFVVRVHLERAAMLRDETSTYSLSIKLQGKALRALPASQDAYVPGTRFHAKARVKCTLAGSPETRECDAFVTRRGHDGTATVEFRWGVDRRRILFVKGKAVSSDSTLAPSAKRSGDNTVVMLGKDETYEVPDALIFGG
ncbi:MAG: hypothetical protein JSS66_02375 [Armatimonadetes bacterium]|nr:hypothetical protein [Armatimonadota bacterium]